MAAANLSPTTRFWKITIGLAIVALGLSAILGQVKGFAGMAAGIGGSFINLYALWAIIRLSSALFADEMKSQTGAIFIVLAFFAKIPLFLGLWLLCGKLGAPSQTYFLIGLGLVYSASVGWSLASR